MGSMPGDRTRMYQIAARQILDLPANKLRLEGDEFR
jgi:hypothetical protein